MSGIRGGERPDQDGCAPGGLKVMNTNSNSRVVWNSEQGSVGGSSYDKPSKPSKRSKTSRRSLPDAGFPKDGTTRVRRETGGRGGKTVTVLYGSPGSDADRLQLFKQIKKICGCGEVERGDRRSFPSLESNQGIRLPG